MKFRRAPPRSTGRPAVSGIQNAHKKHKAEILADSLATGLPRKFKIFIKGVVAKESKSKGRYVDHTCCLHALTSGRVPCLQTGSGLEFVPKPRGSKDRGQKKRERKNSKPIFEEGRPTGSIATYIYKATLLDYPLD